VKLPRESEEGNVEYKSTLRGADCERIERLATQMKYRLFEGGGEAIYILGVDDDGNVVGLSEEDERESMRLLEEAAGKVGAKLRLLSRDSIGGKTVLRLLVRSSREDNPPSPDNSRCGRQRGCWEEHDCGCSVHRGAGRREG